MAILFDESRDAIKAAVARPMPEEPPVIRTVSFRRLPNEDGFTVKVEAIVDEVLAFRVGVGVYQYNDMRIGYWKFRIEESTIYRGYKKTQTEICIITETIFHCRSPRIRRCLSAEKARNGLLILENASD